LVKTLLTHRDLMNENTRALARKIIQKVVDELKKKLKVQVEPAITGAIRRDKHSPRKVYRNLDLNRTIRRNLRNYDNDSGKLLVDRIYYHAAERRSRPWHVIVAVDQSGSMLDSAIFSAVMASIFAELPAVRTSLFLFDTEIADLSDKVGQPVDVLLSIQLGGGTDITKAMQYANQLVSQPARTIVVLITDFYEGGRKRWRTLFSADPHDSDSPQRHRDRGESGHEGTKRRRNAGV
jgi:predicted metal-dependent peptidase